MAEPQSPRELLPEILFYNILPRIPAKLCFMCVSKEWHWFLKTPLFEKLHLHHAIATNDHHQNHLKFLIFSRETLDRFNSSGREGLDQDGLIPRQPFPFDARSERMTVFTSFGGLVCVGITKRGCFHGENSDLILWNPLTGEYKTLSKPSFRIDWFTRAFGLYYTSCDDDYKLLCVTHDLNTYIYSLKSDSWRRADSKENLKRTVNLYPDYFVWPSIALNEKLYFLKYHEQDSTRGSIIRFDTKTDKFTEIATPSFETQYDVFLSFTVLRGCIHFFVIYLKDSVFYYRKSDAECQRVECWCMDENGKWIKEVTSPKASYIITEPLRLMSNGERIIGSSSDGRAWKLDLTRKMIIDISWWRYSPTPDHSMYIPYRGKYIETLVSPNRSER